MIYNNFKFSQQNINTEIGEDDVDEGRSEKKKRRKKKREESDDMAGLDPALTAQMMQQFFQMEQVCAVVVIRKLKFFTIEDK